MKKFLCLSSAIFALGSTNVIAERVKCSYGHKNNETEMCMPITLQLDDAEPSKTFTIGNFSLQFAVETPELFIPWIMGNEPLLAVTIRNEDAESHMSAKLVQGMPSLSLHLKKGDETVFVICDRCVK